MGDFSLPTVLGLILGGLSVLLSIWFFLLSRRRKRPSYSDWSTTFLDPPLLSLPRLHARYDEHRISRLTATRVIFWNGGAETISRHHLVEADPLRIEQDPGTRFLSARVVAQSLSANGFLAEPSETLNSIRCSFNHLDSGHHVVLDLVHTGSVEPLRIGGTIEGAGGATRRLPPRRWESSMLAAGGFLSGGTGILFALSIGSIPPYARVSIALAVVALGAVASWKLALVAQGLPRAARAMAHAPTIADLAEH